MNAIEISSLQFKRTSSSVFTNFNLSLAEGQFIALLGPNGTGKTTLLKLMAGILRSTSGSIQILGQVLHTMKAIERAQYIAYMPQSTNVQTNFTVEQIVSMGRYPHKKRFSNWNKHDQQQVLNALQLTGIEHMKDRSILHLSGGERQLVYLAKAIAQDTPILLLDEPTSDLDVHHQIIVSNVLKQLQEQGKTIVAAIHDINLAARICDQCVLIKDGMIVAQGRPEQVMTTVVLEEGFRVKASIYHEPYSQYIQMLPYATMDCNS